MIIKNKTKLESLARFIELISYIRKDGITPLECLTLATIILTPEKYKYNPLCKAGRKEISKVLKISDKLLNNHIYNLVKAKYLYRDTDDILRITPYFKNLPNQTFTLNVSFTYDQVDIPIDAHHLRDDFVTKRGHPFNPSGSLSMNAPSDEQSDLLEDKIPVLRDSTDESSIDKVSNSN